MPWTATRHHPLQFPLVAEVWQKRGRMGGWVGGWAAVAEVYTLWLRSVAANNHPAVHMGTTTHHFFWAEPPPGGEAPSNAT